MDFDLLAHITLCLQHPLKILIAAKEVAFFLALVGRPQNEYCVLEFMRCRFFCSNYFSQMLMNFRLQASYGMPAFSPPKIHFFLFTTSGVMASTVLITVLPG